MKTQSKRKKFLIITVALALIAFIGIGYAYLAKTLNINGSAKINSDFNVEFQAVQETDTANIGTTTINEAADTVTIDVTITEPGQSYSVVIPVRNTGAITAVLASVTPGAANPAVAAVAQNVTFSFAPANGITVGTTELAVGATHNFNFSFSWANLETEQEALDVTYTFTYTIVYKQA